MVIHMVVMAIQMLVMAIQRLVMLKFVLEVVMEDKLIDRYMAMFMECYMAKFTVDNFLLLKI